MEINSLVFQKEGELLASGDENGEVHIWNPQKSDMPIKSIALDYPISKIAWSPDGQIAIGGGDGTVSIATLDI